MGIRDLLRYDPSSPSGLRWLVDRGCGGKGAAAGAAAGTLQVQQHRYGYSAWRVRVEGKKLAAHRVVWELVTGEPIPPGLEIDHIDGDSTNNRFDNLRLVTHAHNCRNCRRRRANTAGSKGVYFSAHAKGDGAFTAFYRDHNGVEHTRSFAVRKYGRDRARALAIMWRWQRIEELNAEGAGYTARHIGTPVEQAA